MSEDADLLFQPMVPASELRQVYSEIMLIFPLLETHLRHCEYSGLIMDAHDRLRALLPLDMQDLIKKIQRDER